MRVSQISPENIGKHIPSITGLEKGRTNQYTIAINFALSWFYEPCDITLMWIPGHKGIKLNVMADEDASIARQLPEGEFEHWGLIFDPSESFRVDPDLNQGFGTLRVHEEASVGRSC